MNDPRTSPTPPSEPRRLIGWLWHLAKDVIHEYRRDGIGDLAASITFWTILSIPAAALSLISTLSSAGSILGESLATEFESEVRGFLRRTFTADAAINDAVDQLFNDSSTGVATVATLVAVFTLSRAFAGLVRALDVAYDVENGRPFWLSRIVGIGLALGTIAMVLGASVYLAVLPNLPGSQALRWFTLPIVLALMVLWTLMLFHVGPHHKTPWKYDLPGAIFTVLGWLSATQLFALYVRVTSGGNDLTSSVGAILLALTLLYVLSVILLLGAEVNDVIAKRSGVAQQGVDVNASARRLFRRLRSKSTS